MEFCEFNVELVCIACCQSVRSNHSYQKMFEEDFVDLPGLVAINIGEIEAAFLTTAYLRRDLSLNSVTKDDKKIAQPFLNILVESYVQGSTYLFEVLM